MQAFAAIAAQGRVAAQTAIAPVDRNQPLPLSFAQQRLWFLDRLDAAAGAAYHMPVALRIVGVLDAAALRAALDRVVARHESLRTTIAMEDGVPVQRVGDAGCGIAFEVIDLADLADLGPDARTRAIEHATAQIHRRPFDLTEGPLFRGALLRLDASTHLLLLCQHHIVSDGWSLGILLNEVGALYAAFSAGLPDPLAPLPIQYGDYAAWQRARLQGDAIEAQADFWRDHLAGAPALLGMPTDHPRPALQRYEGASVTFSLTPALSARLRQLAQRHGATLFMTVLAAWAALLARFSGQQDVVIGTPVANRGRGEIEGLIGLFVNTLAVRVSIEGEPTVAALLRQVRATMLNAYTHQDIPFDQVVEALNPVRSMSHAPLFQSMLVFDNLDGGKLDLPGLDIGSVGQEAVTAHVDTSLAMREVDGVLGGSLTYATSLFERASMVRLVRSFQSLLEAMAGGEGGRIDGLALLDDAGVEQVTHGFNATAAAFEGDALIHRGVERMAADAPDAVALVFEDRTLDYAELNRQANRLAHRLLALGVRPDDRVALCAERSVEMVVGLLGILKAGAAYVPLDPTLPSERLAFMLADSAPAVLLTQAVLVAALPGHGVPTLVLDGEDAGSIAVCADTDPGVELTSSNLAYVIYTSGSTGQPKGVMNEHGAVVNRLRWFQRQFGLHAGDRVLQKTPFGFDVSVWEFFNPLLCGARIVLARPEGHKSPDYLRRLIGEQGITLVHFVPSMLQAFVDQAQGWQGAGVRCVFCSGEALAPALRARFVRTWPAIGLHNLYGPTEAAVEVTWFDCGSAAWPHLVPIGRPVANTQIHILDRHGRPVPVGVAGEIHIGGMQVARGYLNRPELTAERFVESPYGRLYKTGDLGRWLADGNIDYLGRNDFQVKIRGLRIELGEIDARLAACAGVREAVVLARQDHGGDLRLVAYVAPQAGMALEPAALRAQLGAHLPDYMIPSAFVMLDAFPLNTNGKIDRNALPAPCTEAAAHVAPEGALEHGMAAIWQALLGVERVGRHDNFFELGGHSLLAVQLVSRLRQELNVEASVRQLFTHPTLAGLCAAVAAQAGPHYQHLVPVRAEGEAAPLFLVHPGEGEVGYAFALAAHLDAALPVYGLAARGFGAGETPLDSIEQMARAYLREIRTVQPHGPYRIAGWSAGGTIAWEIANQLIGADEQVAFLGLIDTASDYPAPAGPEAGFDAWLRALDWMPNRLDPATAAQLRALAAAGDDMALLAGAQAAAILPHEIDTVTLRRHLAVRHGIGVALRGYARPSLPVPVALFAAADAGRADSSLGWNAAAGGKLRLALVPGTHYSMMEPEHIGALADALAEALDGADRVPAAYPESGYAPCVALQFGRAGANPLFCVPGAGASVTAFTEVVQALDPDLPVYGLQPRGLCGTMVPYNDVAATARAYVRAIRSIAPHGPYRLLGHSFGGWIATDMAIQLEDAGERVALLAVLDSRVPRLAPEAARWYGPVDVLVRMVNLFEQKLGTSLRLDAGDFAMLGHDARLALLLARLVEARLMPPGTRIDAIRGLVRTFGANLNTEYAPARPYGGVLHFAAASAPQGGDRDGPEALAAGWQPLAAESRVWTSAGNHMTMLARPHVDSLVRWLSPLLKDFPC